MARLSAMVPFFCLLVFGLGFSWLVAVFFFNAQCHFLSYITLLFCVFCFWFNSIHSTQLHSTPSSCRKSYLILEIHFIVLFPFIGWMADWLTLICCCTAAAAVVAFISYTFCIQNTRRMHHFMVFYRSTLISEIDHQKHLSCFRWRWRKVIKKQDKFKRSYIGKFGKVVWHLLLLLFFSSSSSFTIDGPWIIVYVR